MVKCVYKYEKNDKVKQLKQILQKYDYCKSFWIFWNVFSYFDLKVAWSNDNKHFFLKSRFRFSIQLIFLCLLNQNFGLGDPILMILI